MVRVTQSGSQHTNAFTFELSERPDGGLCVVRRPKGFPKVLGTIFQAMGALFLLVTPFAVAQEGLLGAVASLLCAAIGFGIGPVLRNARQVLDVDARSRTIDSAWWIGERRAGLNAHRLDVGKGARIGVKRVRAYKSTAGPPIYMFAIRVAPHAGARPATVLHTDRPEQAEDLTTRMQRALDLVPDSAPEPEAKPEPVA